MPSIFPGPRFPPSAISTQTDTDYLLHIGLCAYRLAALETFTSLPPRPLEQIEKLEQLRFLETGISIFVVLTDYFGVGVDRPEDLQLITRQMVTQQIQNKQR